MSAKGEGAGGGSRARKKLSVGEDPEGGVPEENDGGAEFEKAAAAAPKSPAAATVTPAPKVVQEAYRIVRRCTGSLGGNGAGGAIYGELTIQSMQKVVAMMCRDANLGPDSLFIDIGSGLGKPNLHVALEPHVRCSVGVEMEEVRWQLSLHNLKHVLRADLTAGSAAPAGAAPPNVIFLQRDVMNAATLDPFTHIYLFDIGMPPKLFAHLADCLQKSTKAQFLLCYHGPTMMIEKYRFPMDFLTKLPTSMHGSLPHPLVLIEDAFRAQILMAVVGALLPGSGEGHTAYLYRCHRNSGARSSRGNRSASAQDTLTDDEICASSDPLFKEAFDVLLGQEGSPSLQEWVDLHSTTSTSTSTRRSRRIENRTSS